MKSRAIVLALVTSAVYWIAAAIVFSIFRFALGVASDVLGLAALVGVAPTTALIAWIYLKRLGPRSAMWLSLALVLLHPPADWAYLSRFAPELLWGHLIGWKGIVFYGVLGVVPLVTARLLPASDLSHSS